MDYTKGYISTYYHSNKIEQLMLGLSYRLIIVFNRFVLGVLFLGSLGVIGYTIYIVVVTWENNAYEISVFFSVGLVGWFLAWFGDMYSKY